jgi:hypothetical protein
MRLTAEEIRHVLGLLAEETDADPSEMRARLLASLKPLPRDEQFRVHHAMEQAVTHTMSVLGREEPQRFWRVFRDWTVGNEPLYFWQPVASDGEQGPAMCVTVQFRATRAEAEADGAASGLPAWPGGKR